MNHPHLRLRSALAVLALVACAQPARAQSVVSFTTLAPYVENFDDLNTAFPAGTYATATLNAPVTFGTTFPIVGTNAGNPIVPVLVQPGLTWSTGSTTDFSTGGIYHRGGINPVTSLPYTYSNTNSTRALRDVPESSDFAFGGKLGATGTLIGRFTNATGAGIASWTVAYNIERYSDGTGTASTVSFAYSADGVSYTPLGTDYSAGAGASNAQLASISSTSYSQTVPLTVANSASIYLRWTFFDPSSNGRHVAIDDLVITPTAAIPEPSAFAALAGLGALGLAALRRHRRV